MKTDVRALLWKRLEDSVPGTGRGWESPGPSHQRFLDDGEALTFCCAGGERGAKSTTSAMRAFLLTLDFLALHTEAAKSSVAWIVGSSYEMTRTEHDLLGEWLRQLFGPAMSDRDVSSAVNPGEIRVPTGDPARPFLIKTKSADNPQSLRAEAPVWVIMCEAALQSQETYFRLRGRVGQARSQYPGFGHLIASGSFEGSVGWYPVLWTKWQSPAVQSRERVRAYSWPSHENRFAWPGGQDNEELRRLERELPEYLFKERHLAVPVPPSGRVHDRFDVTVHVRACAYDPELPVYLAVDPGYSGQTSAYAVEVLQEKTLEIGERRHRQWQVVDEIHEVGKTAEQVISIAQSRRWWANGLKSGVIDVAGAAHAGAMESNVEAWLRRTGLVLFNQRVEVLPGIDRFNTMLEIDPLSGEPGLVFDSACVGVISELGGCANPHDGMTQVYQWQSDRQGEPIGRVPRDRWNDGIKALTYFFVNQRGYATAALGRRTIRVINPRRERVRVLR